MSLEITIDANEPAKLAKFWARPLNGYRARPYDDIEIARLARLGLSPDSDPIAPIDGPGPTIWFHKVGAPKLQPGRIPFDLHYSDRLPESELLVGLGVRIENEHDDHVVMIDPGGIRFCVFDPRDTGT